MANNSPTLVMASLSDDQLKKSIDSLVTHVDEAMKKMVQSTNNAVGEMEAKLKSLGNLKVDSGGAADGGASKRAKAQNAETEAVEKNVAARDKQIKKNREVSMSFDQMQTALEKATRLPSEMRIPDMGKSARDSYIAFMQGYKQQAEQTRRLMEEEQKAMQQRRQGVVDGFTKTIEERKARVKELSEEVAKLYKERPDGYRDAIKQRTEEMNALEQKIRELTDAQKNLADSPIGASNRYLELEKEYNRIKNIMIDTTNVQRQSTQETEKQTQATKEYSEQVKKIAAELRQSAQWQKEDKFGFRRGMISLEGRSYPVSENLSMGLRLEDQIISILQRANDERQKGVQTTQQQAQASQRLSEEDRKAAEQLGWIEEKRAKKRYISPSVEEVSQIRAALQSVTGQQEKWVDDIDKTKASYNQLSQYLKELKTIHADIWRNPKNANAAKVIAQEIQTVQRAMQKLQQTMSRPVSLKDALGGSEKTLDDLAYKMRRLQSYRSGLNFKTQSDEVLRVNQKYAELQKKMDVIMERNQRMIASNSALGRSWNYMKNRLAFYITVGAGTSFIKQLIDIRSQYEMNEKALGILLDSASRGTRIFNELSQMALVSPYTLIELSNAAKQLTAYDIAAKDVVDTTRRLADMASAVGVPVERLTYALGQIKAYGYLNSRDARMFANAGIPLVKQLADRYSELEGKMVSTADVYDRMKKKAIDYNDVMAVINKMTDEGGKFFDFQAKMAETLKVRLANLTLAWNNMLNDMGKDNQGWFSSGLKGLTTVFKHWRELYRIISTVIVALGAYKTASMVAGIAASRAVSSTIPAWFRLASIVRTTQGNMALLGLTMRSIPFTAWVTAIATLVSYFILFNNSSDDVKQKLEDIKSAFDGVRKEVETLFADAIKTDNIGAQLTKLRDMLELAETELGVTIPINLEDVNEGNIKQKLKEAKQFVDEYINFSQTFSEAAAGTKFNELMNDFGSKARSTYTNVTESINSVVVALQELSDKGQASKRDIEILNELASGQKEDESRIEYLQRLISLYEELGLIGQEKVEPMIEHNFFKSFFSSTWDNMEELEQNQEENLDRLGIKNNIVFENMLKDVQEYYSSSITAAYQFEQQVMRVAEKIDINNIPVEQRTMKLTAAINEEASQNNWNQFEKEFARQIANEKFGTTIEISDESKKATEEDLQDWQRNIQNWAKNNGITFDVRFQTNDTEASYAKRMLQEAKDAKELWETLGRKEKQGTGSKDATTKAYNDYIERRKLAAAAGADLSSLDAKSRKAASKAEAELAKALKDELSTIDKVRSIYKDLTKEGMSHANAVERATKDWNETVNAINRVLQKNGLQKLDLSKFAGIENPRELVNMLQSQLNTLLKRGAKPAEIKELQTKVNTLEVDADKYDLTKITKGLNNELGKLKDEYELAVELDANPELGGMFLDMFGIDPSDFSHSIDDYMFKVKSAFEKARRELGYGVTIDVFKANDEEWKRWGEQVGLSGEALDNFKARFVSAQGVAKKWATDVVNNTKKLEYELAELNDKIAIKEKEQAQLHERIEKEKNETTKHYLELTYQSNEKAIDELRAQALSLMPEYARVFNSIAEYSAGVSRRLQRDLMKVFDEAKYDSANKKWTLTGKDGKKTILNDTQYRKEREKLTKEMRKSQAPFTKIKEAFKPSDENGVVDYAKGIELVSAEIQKLGSVASEVGNLAQIFGADEQTVEIINDVATSLNGVATAGQGVSQIASGDYIGGAASVLSGITSIIGAWADNSNKEIDNNIKSSERAVKRLELAYIDLERAINKAYGTGINEAKQAAAAAKKLELYELERQLRLEKSRDSKHRDEDRIIELQKQIKELKYEIEDMYNDIVNDLLGSDVGSFAENLVSTMAEAFKQGEDYMEVFNEKFDEMIDNMIIKSITSRIVASYLDKLWEDLNNRIKERSEKKSDAYVKAQNEAEQVAEYSDYTIASIIAAQKGYVREESENYKDIVDKAKRGSVGMTWFGGRNNEAQKYYVDAWQQVSDEEIAAYKAMIEERKETAEKELKAATEIGDSDINYLMEEVAKIKHELGEKLKNIFANNWQFGQDSEKTLSSLQQGIQGITEDTAGALEAYMNGMSQQAYLRNDLLTQIRDTIMSFDMDIQLGVFSQMLLQLQNNYIVMQSMQSMMENWTVPSGSGIRVELMS